MRPLASGARMSARDFLAAASEEEAMARLADSNALLPESALKLQRRLSVSEIDMHQIGPETIMQWP